MLNRLQKFSGTGRTAGQLEFLSYRNQADSPEAAQKNFRKMQVQFPET
jgi:hypothetical protein